MTGRPAQRNDSPAGANEDTDVVLRLRSRAVFYRATDPGLADDLHAAIRYAEMSPLQRDEARRREAIFTGLLGRLQARTRAEKTELQLDLDQAITLLHNE
jgi:hypothetical protein